MTTTVVSTIGSGGDYSSIAAWNAAAPSSLVTADQIWQGNCLTGFSVSGGTSTIATLGGSTSDATHYKLLTTAAGASFRDNGSVQTNALRANGSNGVLLSATVYNDSTFKINEAYARVSKLQFENLSSTNSPAVEVTSTNNQISACIIEGQNSSFGSPLKMTSADGFLVKNTLIVNRASAPVSVITLQGMSSGAFVNVTAAVPSDKTAASGGIFTLQYTSGITAENFAAFGGALPSSGIAFTTSFNEHSSPPTGVTQVSYDTSTGSGFQATTDSARDFRIKSTSALKDAGTTDSTNAGTDIAGTARPAGASYDVGAWEFASISIVFTTPASGTVIQHVSGTGSISATGTYSGSPTHLRAKLINDADSSVVTGFDWATVVSTPSGGTFSFTLTGVPKAAGWYRVVMDFSNDATQTATSNKVGVGEIIGCVGQSNMNRMFAATGGSATPSALLRQYTSSAWNSTISSPIATLGNALIASLGCVVGIVNTAVDGTTITQWNPTGDSSSYTAAMAIFTTLGAKLSAMVFAQGESDWNGTSGSSYATQLGQVFDGGFRTALGQSTLPVIIVSLPQNTAGTGYSTYDAIKAAEYTYALGSAYNFIVESADIPVDPADGTHHLTAGWTTLAGRYAQAIAAAKGVTPQYRGPSISAVVKINSTTYDVVFQHHSGNDYTPSAAITAFSVTDPGASGAPITITSATRQSATRVRLVLATTPVSLPKVSHLLTSTPTLTGLVYDNSLLTLPTEYNSGVVAVVPATTVTLTLTTDGSTAAASLTGLKWAFYEQAHPDVFAVPVSQGTAGSTDGSGVLTLTVSTVLAVGAVGWLTISNSDGTTTQSPAESAFSGPVTLS